MNSFAKFRDLKEEKKTVPYEENIPHGIKHYENASRLKQKTTD